MVEMAETEASLRSVASQPFRIFMSLLLVPRKRWTTVSITAQNKKRSTKSESHFSLMLMVEMAVIETASENLFPKLSTSVVYRLKFPFLPADTRAGKIGSSLRHDRLQSAYPFTFTASWRFLLSRSTLREALPLFKQQVKLYYLCRLFLNLKLLLWCLATARLLRFKIPVEILSSPDKLIYLIVYIICGYNLIIPVLMPLDIF